MWMPGRRSKRGPPVYTLELCSPRAMADLTPVSDVWVRLGMLPDHFLLTVELFIFPMLRVVMGCFGNLANLYSAHLLSHHLHYAFAKVKPSFVFVFYSSQLSCCKMMAALLQQQKFSSARPRVLHLFTSNTLRFLIQHNFYFIFRKFSLRVTERGKDKGGDFPFAVSFPKCSNGWGLGHNEASSLELPGGLPGKPSLASFPDPLAGTGSETEQLRLELLL